MRIWDTVRLFSIFVRLVRNPSQTELIFKAVGVASKYKNEPVAIQVVKTALARESFKNLYEQVYLPEWPSLAELKAYPENSFGSALYKHLLKNNLDLDLFPRFQPGDAIEYLNARAYQDHDLWHVLFGYGIELEDELALQGFGVAQFESPLGGLIIAGGILHLLIFDPGRASGAIKKVAEGYQLGTRVRFLLGEKLIEMLPLPLNEVRAHVGYAAA